MADLGGMRGGSGAILGAFGETFPFQQAAKSCKAKLERHKDARRDKEQQNQQDKTKSNSEKQQTRREGPPM